MSESPPGFGNPISGGALPSAVDLAALKNGGYIRYEIMGHQDLFRLPGWDPLPWQDALIQMGGMLAMVTAENIRLRQVGPKPWLKDWKMLAVAIPALPTVGLQMSGAFDEYLATLSPQTGMALKLIIGTAAALAVAIYTQQHTNRGIQQAEAVRQIPPATTPPGEPQP